MGRTYKRKTLSVCSSGSDFTMRPFLHEGASHISVTSLSGLRNWRLIEKQVSTNHLNQPALPDSGAGHHSSVSSLMYKQQSAVLPRA